MDCIYTYKTKGMITIDTIYEGVVQELTQTKKIIDMSKKLFSIKNNAERVLFVCDIIESLKAYPDILVVNKDEKVSVYYRNLGNKCYQKDDHYQAWQYYNLALMHAPVKTEAYCVAISNRSAVFESLRKNEACLADIKKALSLNCPKQIAIKLKKRQATIKQKKTRLVQNLKSSQTEMLLLKSPTHERYLCASNKLNVVFTEEMGRHVVANENIKVGEVLAREAPYSQLLIRTQYLFACSFCFSRNPNLMPCENCCFALYCSEKCKTDAYKSYHSVECPLMAVLIKLDFTKLELLALRTVIQSCNDYANWEELFKAIEEAEKNENTEFHGCVKIDDKWVFDSKYYPSIHSLASNVEKRSMSDIFQKSVTAAVLLNMLRNSKLLKGKDENEEKKILNFVAGGLLHHNMTTPTNMHGLSSNAQDNNSNYILDYQIASAAYGFHSLLNHSCAPNVVRVHELGTSQMALIALRPIQKGMQLFDNYGQHHALAPCVERQADLMFQYKFKCRCEACVDNWELYFKLISLKRSLPQKIARQINTLLSQGVIEKLQKGNLPNDKFYQEICELAECLEPFGPCKELADCQETIKQCLFIFGGLVDSGYKKIVNWNAVLPKM